MTDVTPTELRDAPARPAFHLWLLPLTALLLVAVAILSLVNIPPPHAINGDTAWLITVIEKVQQGAVPYRDVLETNPPMSILIYWPAVALAQFAGLLPETGVYLMFAAVTGLVLALSGKILRSNHTGEPHAVAAPQHMLALGVLGVLLLVFPAQAFSQREQLAVMFLMPFLLLQMRSKGDNASGTLALSTGLLAGLAICVKPHFALAAGLPLALLAGQARSVRPVFQPAALAAGAVALIYAALVPMLFPAFFSEVWPLLRDGYMQAGFQPLDMMFLPSGQLLLLALATGGIASVLPQTRRKETLLLMAAAVGFAIAFALQGKGFFYHALPVVICALAALLLPDARTSSAPPSSGGWIRLALALPLAIAATVLFHKPVESNDLGRDILALKSAPKLIIIAPSTNASFPLAREIGAVWSTRLCCAWIASSLHTLLEDTPAPAVTARREALAVTEAGVFADDIRMNRPDIIVFDNKMRDMQARMMRHEAFAEAMRGYAPAGTSSAGRFMLFQRDKTDK